MLKNKDDLINKRKREDLVFGIFLSTGLGFLINIFSNIFYDSQIKNISLDISNTKIFLLLASLVLIIGFLFFLIDDYKNEINLDKKFLKRFTLYLGYKFKITSYLFKFFLLLVGLSGVGLIFSGIVLAFNINIYTGFSVLIFIILILYKDLIKKN